MQRPDYSRSIYNIPNTILQIFGISSPQSLRDFKDVNVDKVALILIDGMGENIYSKSVGLRDANHYTITSIFPSTTAAALTTFLTGLSPREHGILEFRMYYEICGKIIKTLPFSPVDSYENDSLIKEECSPEQLFSLPTIFSKLHNEGISSCGLLRGEYWDTFYSKFLFDHARRVPYNSIKHAFNILPKLEEDFIFLYLDYLDNIEHHFGPYSPQSIRFLNHILMEIENFRKRAKNRTILVTADHGLMHIQKKRFMQVPHITDKIGGSPRDVFVYTQINEKYEAIASLPKTTLLQDDLLGPGNAHPALHLRIPERVLLPPEGETLWYQPFQGKGLHGGLSKDEMLVPLLVLE